MLFLCYVLCNVVCYVLLSYDMLCHVMSYNDMLYHVVLCFAPFHISLCYYVLCGLLFNESDPSCFINTSILFCFPIYF